MLNQQLYNKSMQPTVVGFFSLGRGPAAADLNCYTSKSLRSSVAVIFLALSSCILLPSCARTVVTHELRYPEAEEPGYKIKRLAPPDYPQNLYHNLVEGVVEIEFDIDSNGETRNIEMTKKSPEPAFNQAALESVRNTTYLPPGELPYERNTRVVRFKLDKNYIKRRCLEISPDISAQKPLCQD